MDQLIALLEDALNRARTVTEPVPRARIEAAETMARRIIRIFPPDPVHVDVTSLTGAHVDAMELRGLGEPEE